MSDDNIQANAVEGEASAKLTVEVFRVMSPVDEFREIARIHFREAQQLLERAHRAKAEDLEHEANLLMDLSVARWRRAEQYVKAAKGEGEDPIVSEILDSLQEQRESFTPAKGQVVGFSDQLESALETRISRALAWIDFLK